jgi:hypothetical protein
MEVQLVDKRVRIWKYLSRMAYRLIVEEQLGSTVVRHG